MKLKEIDHAVNRFNSSSRYIDGRSEDMFVNHLKQLIKQTGYIVFWYGAPKGFFLNERKKEI